MNILITGYKGFIGKNLINELSIYDNYNLLLIGNNKSKYNTRYKNKYVLNCDIDKINNIKKKIIDFKPDIVIHLAWKGIPVLNFQNSYDSLKFSIKFFELIFNFTNCKKVIVSGSCNEYSNNKGVCKEKDYSIPLTFFSWSKLSLYEYLLLKCKEKKI